MVAEESRKHVGTTIRAFLPADATAVTKILRAAPEASQWTELGFKELLAWRGVLALVSEENMEISGFIVGRQVADEAEILNLAVRPASRRKGEGGELLKAAMDEFRTRHARRLFLEVRESNAGGIAFYRKHGFAKSGERPRYYSDSKEAAVTMETKLTG
jgi:ribosomal-protein-alanine N-acetyltransferase